jgi:hypothetical protein
VNMKLLLVDLSELEKILIFCATSVYISVNTSAQYRILYLFYTRQLLQCMGNIFPLCKHFKFYIHCILLISNKNNMSTIGFDATNGGGGCWGRRV